MCSGLQKEPMGRRGRCLRRNSTQEVDLQSEESEDVSLDASRLNSSVVAERLEGGEDNEDGRPAVVKGEGQVDEDLVRSALWLVVLLDDVVDVRDRHRNKKREDESYECPNFKGSFHGYGLFYSPTM